MSARDIDIVTCSLSLTEPGRCCEPQCSEGAISAVLDDDLCEHTRCAFHDHAGNIMARKPLRWSQIWGPS